MMPEATRAYIILSQAWYGPANLERRPDLVDEISFGLMYPDGSVEYMTRVEWVPLFREQAGARLCVFADEFEAFTGMADVFESLGARIRKVMTPPEFIDLLHRQGFEDWTPRERT